MAANQAASLTEDKNIIVIPTKTIPQGITALVNYIPDSTPEDNAERMGEEIQLVKTGQVTYAVRDTVIDDKEIKQDDYMGIGDKGILSVGTDMEKTVLEMIGEILKEDFYILPSSIHEVIILPKSREIAKEELDAMIQDINHTQVDTEEVLSDHAYLYERGLGKIQMAF